MRDTELYAVPPLSTISSPNLWYASKAAQNDSVTLAGEFVAGWTENLSEELRTEVVGWAFTMAEVTMPYVPRWFTLSLVRHHCGAATDVSLFRKKPHSLPPPPRSAKNRSVF